MLDKQLREIKERVLMPAAKSAGKVAHPTTLSVIGFAFGVGAGFAAWGGWYALGFLLWGINRFMDGLDGTVARVHNKQSDFGGYVDILLDFAVYAWIPAGLALGNGSTHALIAAVFLISTFYLNAASWSFLAAIIEKRGLADPATKTSVILPTGLIEGAETVIFYGVFFLLPGELVILFGLMGSLVLMTVLQRLIWAGRNL